MLSALILAATIGQCQGGACVAPPAVVQYQFVPVPQVRTYVVPGTVISYGACYGGACGTTVYSVPAACAGGACAAPGFGYGFMPRRMRFRQVIRW